MIEDVGNCLRYIFKCSGFGISLLYNTVQLIFCLMLLIRAGDVESNPGPTNESGSLSILHLNIRSIRNKISYIEDTFADFDILCFTETHLSCDVETSSLRLDGYGVPFRKDKTPHSGGILVYTADHIFSDRMLNLDFFWNEIVWIQVKTHRQTYAIGTIYRPPSASVEFWDLLNRNLEFITDTIKKCHYSW